MIRTHILLTVSVGLAAADLVCRMHAPIWTAMQTVGLCLVVVGFGCLTIARFQLGGAFSVTAQARKLVTRGLYSKIRNPMYVFSSCLVAGAILVLGRPVWLLILLVLIPLQLWRSRKESAVLEAAFGDEYREYRAGTWF
jgi:protein-S-isoprenylcysteine O-methyltransferase Ste14